jgi:hypothetical protein
VAYEDASDTSESKYTGQIHPKSSRRTYSKLNPRNA